MYCQGERRPGGREGEERTGEREIISTNHSRDVLSGIIKPFADWSARRLVKKSCVNIIKTFIDILMAVVMTVVVIVIASVSSALEFRVAMWLKRPMKCFGIFVVVRVLYPSLVCGRPYPLSGAHLDATVEVPRPVHDNPPISISAVQLHDNFPISISAVPPPALCIFGRLF